MKRNDEFSINVEFTTFFFKICFQIIQSVHVLVSEERFTAVDDYSLLSGIRTCSAGPHDFSTKKHIFAQNSIDAYAWGIFPLLRCRMIIRNRDILHVLYKLYTYYFNKL